MTQTTQHTYSVQVTVMSFEIIVRRLPSLSHVYHPKTRWTRSCHHYSILEVLCQKCAVNKSLVYSFIMFIAYYKRSSKIEWYNAYPSNTMRWSDVGLLLAHRRRR